MKKIKSKERLPKLAKAIKEKVEVVITSASEKFSDLFPSHYGMNDAEYPEWYIKQMNEKKQGNNEK